MNVRPGGTVGKEYVPLYIKKDERNVFLACLGLGTLYAIRSGALPAEAGIWTLGRPNVWSPLEGDPEISREVITVFSAADELSLVQQLRPHEFDATVERYIRCLENVLRETGDQYWIARWHMTSGDHIVLTESIPRQKVRPFD